MKKNSKKIKQIMSEKLSSIIPVGTGGLFAAITASGLFQCVVYAIVGAVVGWLIKSLLNFLFRKNKRIKDYYFFKKNKKD